MVQFKFTKRSKSILAILIVAVFLGTSVGGALLTQGGADVPTVIQAGSMVSEASYIIFVDDNGMTCAKNGTSGVINYRSSNASYVISSTISEGSSIQFAPGTIDIPWPITINEKCTISGHDTILINTAPVALDRHEAPYFFIVNADDTKIEGINFNTSIVGEANGIKALSDRGQFIGNTFENLRIAIRLTEGSSQSLVSENAFTSRSAHWETIAGKNITVGQVLVTSPNNIITHNYFYDIAWNGVRLSASENPTGTVITENSFVDVAWKDDYLSAIHIENVGSQDITNILVSKNTIRWTQTIPVVDWVEAILIDGEDSPSLYVRNITVSENIIDCNGFGEHVRAIYCHYYNSAHRTVQDLNIRGNTVINASYAIICLSSNYSVSYNQLIGCGYGLYNDVPSYGKISVVGNTFKQSYVCALTIGGLYNSLIAENVFIDNFKVNSTWSYHHNNTYRDNIGGLKSEVWGYIAITGGASDINIAHGLFATPEMIQITPNTWNVTAHRGYTVGTDIVHVDFNQPNVGFYYHFAVVG